MTAPSASRRAMEPAAKLAAFVTSAVVVATTPGWRPLPLFLFALLTALLAAAFRAPLRPVAGRLLAASPVILLAAAMLAWQAGVPSVGVAMASKAFIVILLFAVLTTTTPVSDLLRALRSLGLPPAAGSILALMDRYVRLLGEEFRRMRRARASRTTRPLGAAAAFRGEGQLAGALLLRSWNRSDRIYQAMLARGFTGDWPGTRRHSWRTADAAALIGVVAAFVAVRWL